MKVSRVVAVLAAIAIIALGGRYCWKNRPEKAINGLESPQQGGRVVVTYRSEPGSFNRFTTPTAAADLVTRLTQATLVRVDRTTATLEPRLARSWTASPDGLTWTFELRDDVVFPDGQPFTSADVVFTLKALYDERARNELASSFLINGKPLQVRALGPHRVEIVCPSVYGPGISLMDSLPILPAHKLAPALEAGAFRDAWSVTTPLTEIIGLGPFVLKQYVPGQSLTVARNPRYWRADAAGMRLPYLDEIEIQFTPDQSAEVLRLKAGQSDLMTDRVRFEDLASLQQAEKEKVVALHEAGISISPDMLWFNLRTNTAVARAKPWLLRGEFRHALSQAVSRTAIVNTIFLGEAVEVAGPITPGHGDWFDDTIPKPEFDPEAASRMLRSMGLIDKDGDAMLEDASGSPVAFTLMTQRGHSVRENTAALIAEQLKRVGVRVDVVPVDPGTIKARWDAGDYEAIFFAIEPDSFDPGRNTEFWLSSGNFHMWNPRQSRPSTSWEGQIDDLVRRQSTTANMAERQKLMAAAQRIFSEHSPILYFAAPKVMVASSARLKGVQASPILPTVLWNSEMLFVTDAASGKRD